MSTHLRVDPSSETTPSILNVQPSYPMQMMTAAVDARAVVEEIVAPPAVTKHYKLLKRKGNGLHKSRLPCHTSTFHVCPDLAKPYSKNKTATFKLHILDPQVLGAPDTPYPVHGFCGRVTANGWIKKPRVAHGIRSSEYFVGRR